jgi:hypothetical protein
MRASRDQGSPADAEQACLCNARESSRLEGSSAARDRNSVGMLDVQE